MVVDVAGVGQGDGRQAEAGRQQQAPRQRQPQRPAESVNAPDGDDVGQAGRGQRQDVAEERRRASGRSSRCRNSKPA